MLSKGECRRPIAGEACLVRISGRRARVARECGGAAHSNGTRGSAIDLDAYRGVDISWPNSVAALCISMVSVGGATEWRVRS